MSSTNGEQHVTSKEDEKNISSENGPPPGSRVACDSENGDIVTKELSPEHTCTADKSCSEQEAVENKTPQQSHENLPNVAKSSQEVDNSIKSPPIDTSFTDDGNTTEKILDEGNDKDSSTNDDSDEWLDILGSGHLKKKVNINLLICNNPYA